MKELSRTKSPHLDESKSSWGNVQRSLTKQGEKKTNVRPARRKNHREGAGGERKAATRHSTYQGEQIMGDPEK